MPSAYSALNMCVIQIRGHIRDWLPKPQSLAYHPQMQDSPGIAVLEPAEAPSLSGEGDDYQYFTERDYRKLLEVARVDPRDFWYSAIHFAWCTGLRLKEVAQLQWQQIDWEQESLMVVVSTGAGRPAKELQIPLDPDLYDRLFDLKKHNDAKCLVQCFVHPAMAGSYRMDKHKFISAQFIRLCQKAGIQDKSFMCFRRTFIRDLLFAGVNNQAIADLTGVVDPRRIAPNLSLPLDAKRQALLRLSGYRRERLAA